MAVAGVVIAGLAIGAAIGTGLRHAFGEARAVRAEEAQEEVFRLVRSARRKIEAAQGKTVTQAQARQLFSAAEANLIKLGFTRDPATGNLRRTRSAIERILG